MTDSQVTVLAALVAGGAALIAAALAALITAVVTYKVTNRSVRAAEEQAASQRQHEVALAWTDRDQARKLDAYQTLTRYVLDREKIIQWKLNDESFKTEPPTPEPTADEPMDFAAHALAALVGTRDVWAGLKVFQTEITRISVSVGIAKRLDPGAIPIDPATTAQATKFHADIRKHCQDALQAGEAVIELMRQELSPDVT